MELAKALWTQGSARYRLGEPRAALSLGEQSLVIATELNNPNEMGRSLNLIGAVYYVLGQYSQAESYWENALKLFQDLGNRQQGMDLLSNLGAIADVQGDYDTAFHRFHNALEIAREIGHKDGEITRLRIECGSAPGNYSVAEADLRLAIQLASMNGSWILPLSFNYHAEALIGLSRYEEALHSAQQALALGEEEKTPEYIGMAWRTLGMVSEKLRKPISLRDRETRQIIRYDTDTCFSKSERIFAETEIEIERARTLREWAKCAFRLDNQEQAKKMWHESREVFARLGADMEVQRMATPPA
jgi:tetratricopeptide (TPR) repeat protein